MTARGFAVALAATGLLASAASAQDFGGPRGLPSWTGVYAGAQAGLGLGSVRGGSAGGGLLGGYLGINTQAERIVLGVESDIMASTLEHKGFHGGAHTFKQKWVGSLRGRAGIAFDQVLVFGTFGLAGAANTMTDFGGNAHRQTLGWAAGGGAEMQLAPRLALRGELMHYALGQATYRTPVAVYRLDTRSTALRAGLGYRF